MTDTAVTPPKTCTDKAKSTYLFLQKSGADFRCQAGAGSPVSMRFPACGAPRGVDGRVEKGGAQASYGSLSPAVCASGRALTGEIVEEGKNEDRERRLCLQDIEHRRLVRRVSRATGAASGWLLRLQPTRGDSIDPGGLSAGMEVHLRPQGYTIAAFVRKRKNGSVQRKPQGMESDQRRASIATRRQWKRGEGNPPAPKCRLLCDVHDGRQGKALL